MKFLTIQNPTLNFQVGNIANIPIKYPKDNCSKNNIDKLSGECIEISRNDWDSFETSWDFQKHPLMKFKSNTIQSSFESWVNLLMKNSIN